MTTEGTAFGAALRRLRLAAGLTQERLAERAGVSAKAVIALEKDPGRTPRLETVTRLADALGLDRDDRARLLAAARPTESASRGPDPTERPRPVPVGSPTPIRRGVVARAMPPSVPQPTSLAEQAAQAEPTRRPPLVALAPRRQDWGEAPDAGELHGRAPELATLRRWVEDDGCRLVAIVGMGGVGKTSLAARLARELAADFEAMYWRSVRNAPPCIEWLGGAILFLSDQQSLPAEGEEARLRQLLELLRARRCLLVLDNLETVIGPGAPEVQYRPGYAGYGQLLQWLGEAGHRSCLIVTSREVPPEVGPRAGAQGPVRALRLGGIDTTAGRALLADRGLVGDAAAWEALVARYGGNALALQLVGETIAELFGGQIAAFLDQGEAVFGDVRRLLDAQVARLSDPERAVLDWLAIEREPVNFGTLLADLSPVLTRGAALEALETLGRRSLLEQGQAGAIVTLQPVVLEYATDRLVDRLADEIGRGEPAWLVSHAVIKARAREYVRQSQERLIGEPVLRRLNAHHGEAGTAQRLLALVDRWRDRSVAEQGYGPGNVVNLLRLLRGDLRGLDLSRLAIRQAYLAEVNAQDTTMVGAQLSEVALPESFIYPMSVALSADGQFLAAGASTGDLTLWNVPGRRLVAALQAHTGAVTSVAMTADARVVVSGSLDGTIRAWDPQSGRLLLSLEGNGDIYGVAVSEDGRAIAGGGLDGAVRIWDAQDGRLLSVLAGHTGLVYTVTFSVDRRLVASGGFDGTVRLWDAERGQLVATLRGHTNAVHGVALSRDGRLVVSGSFDGTVRVWEAASGQALAVLEGHTGSVQGVALSADASRLASCSFDGTVKLWETASGSLLATLLGHTASVRGVALDAAGRLVTSGSLDGTIRVWEAPSGRLLVRLQGQNIGVRSVALGPDGALVAGGYQDGTVRLWDAQRGTLRATLRGETGLVYGVALSGDGRLIASGGQDRVVRVWEAASGRLLMALQGHTSAVQGVGLSYDGRLLVSGCVDGLVKLWDAERGQLVASLGGHIGGVTSVAVSADGRLAASGGMDGTTRLWDVRQAQAIVALDSPGSATACVVLDEAGLLVASGSQDGTAHLWETTSGRLVATLRGHTNAVQGVALDATGRLVVSGSQDGTVRLWDADGGRPRAALRGHRGLVYGVAVTRDGRLAVSGGFDGTIRVWDTRDGTCLRTLRAEGRYERMDITGLTGVTAAQRAALLALGAVDRSAPASGA
jgi:WD40 repeat protein/DNA-binding XRE family transcriptional regulator